MKPLLKLTNNLRAELSGLPRNMRLFLINVLAYGATVEGISAVLLNLYLLRLGYGTEFIGTINSAGLFIFALVSLPIGAVQRFSSRQMMQFGQVMSLIGILGIPLAYYITEGQAALLIGSRILAMVGLSAYFVHQIPFAMDITKPAWHNKALSITMAVFSLAAFLGSWFGGLLPQLFGNLLNLPLTDARPYQMPMFLASVLILPAMMAIRLIPNQLTPEANDEEKAEETATGITVNWRHLVGLVAVILVVRMFQTAGVGVVNTFSNVYFDDALSVPTSQIGFISGLGRLLGVPMSLIIPWLITRYDNFKLVHISLGLIVLLILPMALIPYWPIAALALISINSMGSLRYLSFVGFTMSLVSDKQRSLMSGAGEMAIGGGFAVSSFIGGYLIAWYGYRELFLFGASMTVIGAVAFWLIFRGRARKLTAVPAH
ncbi:MAG: MFS transporter [Chloroflexota bacterium]